MGIPIKRIIKTVTKQVPDIVQETADRTARTVRAVSPTTITTPDINVPNVSTVIPNQTVTNRLGVPIGIGTDVSFDTGRLTGTIFSGNSSYDLAKIYDDFDRAGITPRYLNDYVSDVLNSNGGVQKLFETLPLSIDFKPQLDFNIKGWPETRAFTPITYRNLMQSAGYNMNAIRNNLDRSAKNIINGTPLYNWRMSLLNNLEPHQINEHNFDQFIPRHIVQNMNEDIASNIFYRRMDNIFEDSKFNLQTNRPTFSYAAKPITSIEQAASDFLTQKYPEFNFDLTMNQFTPAYANQNIPTIEFLRQRNPSLPFDFKHFYWTQSKIPTGSTWGTRGPKPNVGMSVYKSLGELKERVPRGYAITETNTSPDSEVLKLVMSQRNYGTNPGQSSVRIINPRGHRNTLQNSAVWFEDLINDPQIPQSEKLKLLQIQQNGGIDDVTDWLNSETYLRAQNLYNQRAIPDMQKLHRHWLQLKKLDPTIKDFNISIEPFSKYDFKTLMKVGNVTPRIYSPDFHIIKHKNGGQLLKHWNLAISGLKKNNKFGN